MLDNNCPDGAPQYNLMLFIAGMTPHSAVAVENLRRICDQFLEGRFALEIVDVNKEKHKAVEHEIIAIPTLVRTRPVPRRMVLGDLSQTEKVLKMLDIHVTDAREG